MSVLSFHGAAGTVTGSCTMLAANGACLLVDCGLFQGNKSVRALNAEPFPFDAAAVDAVLLTHAHTDHAGLLPKLVRAGFAGRIHATRPTVDLLDFMMRDSARIQEAETARENRKRQRRGQPEAPPIFIMEDAEEALTRLLPLDYEAWVEPAPGIHARYWNAGHILGSASVELRYPEAATGNTMRLLFSGDIGPDEKVFHPGPEAERGFDYVICESTYGDRERDDYSLAERRAALRAELTEGLGRGGNVVIPCFAVERSQELLHDIGTLLARREIPPCTVFLDSPLARRVTEVFVRHAHTLEDVEIPEDRLFRDPSFRITESVEDSKAINRIQGGAVIISASGMADAGRILHHLKNNIWRREATVLFVGYQAPGTLGHIIRSGKEQVRIHGRDFKVRATVRGIGNYSAHADRSELVDWVRERGPVAGGIFLNHGDDAARAALADRIAETGIARDRIWLPAFDESFELAAGPPVSKGRGPARIRDDALEADWQNDHAAFQLALHTALEEAPGDARRRAILAALAAALETA